jgi:tetratricopeptide (TPR) repeat protein
VVSIASTSETDGADLNRDLSLLLEEGAIYFRRAVAESDAEAARELYLQALLRFEWIVHEGGVENGRLLYNIGNIYYRLGELGKAILHYRRAEYYIPGDPNLRHNLRYIRSLRLDSVGVSYPSRVFAILSFRNTPLSPRRHLQLFALFFASAWIFGALFLLRRKRWKSVAIVCSALAAVFIFSSLIGVELGWRNRREGVVTVKEVVARRGDGEMYESSFQEPLHDGTEFNVLDEREGWYLIQLSNGGTGWIPVDSAELIRM